ncbi:hypothetical protein N9241_01335 [bacterium]|nr:hypothetical protein [bacterium]
MAEQKLDIRMLKDINSKKIVTPSDKTRAAGYLEDENQVSERKTCQILTLNRNT